MSLLTVEIGPGHEPEKEHTVPLLRAGGGDRQGYGSVPSAGDSNGDPELALDTFPCSGGGEGKGEEGEEEEVEGEEGAQPRRVAVDLRKYIFLSMGIPSAMPLSREFRRNCILLSSLLYFLLFIQGLVIVVVTLRSENWLKEKAELFPVKVATGLSGLFFILLEGYWLALLWWSHPSRTCPSHRHCHPPEQDMPLNERDFSIFGLLWWLLSVYFVAVLTSLLTEVCRHFGAVFGSGDADMWSVRAAFVCMLACLYVYLSIFLVMMLEGCVADRWGAEKHTGPKQIIKR